MLLELLVNTNVSDSKPRIHIDDRWQNSICMATLPKSNIAPENCWLEAYFPFNLGRPIFRGCVSFRECMFGNFIMNYCKLLCNLFACEW